MENEETSIILPHGNYQELHSFQTAEVIYDLTFCFCGKHLKENGLRERMTKARLLAREQQRRDERRR